MWNTFSYVVFNALPCDPKIQYYPVILRCRWVQNGELPCESVAFLDDKLLLESLFSLFICSRSKKPLVPWAQWAFGCCPFCWVNDYLVCCQRLKELFSWCLGQAEKALQAHHEVKNNQIRNFYNSIFNLKTTSKLLF